MTYIERSLKDYPSLKGKCPFFKYGKCFSPLLSIPSSASVNPDRCETIFYKTCRFYKLGVKIRERESK